MKKRVLSLFLVSFMLIILLMSLVSADIGRKSSISLDVKQNGESISDQILVCHDGNTNNKDIVFFEFSLGKIDLDEELDQERYKDDRNYEYVKELKEKEYASCFYCHPEDNRECRFSYYPNGEPTKIAVLDPTYSFYKDSGEITPILYESSVIFRSTEFNFDTLLEVTLNPDQTMDVKARAKTSRITIINLILALIITFLFERWATNIYYKRIKKKQRPKNILGVLALINVISLPIFWFGIPLVINNFVAIFIVGEVFVFLLEACLIYLFLKKKLTFKNSIILSLINNLASMILGGIVFLFIGKFLMLF
jgi:hypothetical protein